MKFNKKTLPDTANSLAIAKKAIDFQSFAPSSSAGTWKFGSPHGTWAGHQISDINNLPLQRDVGINKQLVDSSYREQHYFVPVAMIVRLSVNIMKQVRTNFCVSL